MLLVQESSKLPSQVERNIATGLRYIIIEQVLANCAWDGPHVPDSENNRDGTYQTYRINNK